MFISLKSLALSEHVSGSKVGRKHAWKQWLVMFGLALLGLGLAPKAAQAQANKVGITGNNLITQYTGAAISKGFTVQTQNTGGTATAPTADTTLTFVITDGGGSNPVAVAAGGTQPMGRATLSTTVAPTTVTFVSATTTTITYTNTLAANTNNKLYTVTFPVAQTTPGNRPVVVSGSGFTGGSGTLNNAIFQNIVFDGSAGVDGANDLTRVAAGATNFNPEVTPAVQYVLQFGPTIPSGITQALVQNSALTVYGIDFQAGGFSISGTGAITNSALNPNPGNSVGFDMSVANVGTATINNPVFISGSNVTSFDVADGNTLIFTGVLNNNSSGQTKVGAGTLQFAGTASNTGGNDNFGAFTAGNGTTELNKTSGASAIFSNGLFFITGGTVRLLQPNQIADNVNASTVRMTGGTFDLNGQNETVSAIAFANAGVGPGQKASSGGGAVTTGAGTLTLAGVQPIVYGTTNSNNAAASTTAAPGPTPNPTAVTSAAALRPSGAGTTGTIGSTGVGSVFLSNTTDKTFLIENSTSVNPDVDITSPIGADAGGNLRLSGLSNVTVTGTTVLAVNSAGQLRLSAPAGTNTFTNPFIIDSGELQLGNNEQLADAAALTVNTPPTGLTSVFNLNGNTETVGPLSAADGTVLNFGTLSGATVAPLNANGVTLNGGTGDTNGPTIQISSISAAGGTFALINNTSASPIAGRFAGTQVDANTTTVTVSGITATVVYNAELTNDGSANDVTITFSSTNVANSLIVTNTSDTGTGSLRAALTAANALSGASAGNPLNIVFNITGTPNGTGVNANTFVITPASALPTITNSFVNIDGTTQTGFGSGNTNANGPEVVLNGSNPLVPGAATTNAAAVAGLTIQGANCTVKSLVIGNFSGAGIQFNATTADNNSITGCYIGVTPDGLTRAYNGTGTSAVGGVAVFDGVDNLTIGGTTTADRNIISGAREAIQINAASVSINNLTIQGNFIGTGRDGIANVGANNLGANGTAAIGVANTAGMNGALIKGNLISNNAKDGINIVGGSGSVTRNLIQGNFIGIGGTVSTNGTFTPDRATAAPNSFNGIAISATGSTVIGGTNAGEGNIIANNGVGNASGLGATQGGHGVNVTNNGKATIRRNEIFANAQLGINLTGGNATETGTVYTANNRPTVNDANDLDTGGNNSQNFPVLSSAVQTSTGGDVTIKGTLSSVPNSTYAIDFYLNASTEVDASGFGEGRGILGGRNITTAADGQANFSFTYSGNATITTDSRITATATFTDTTVAATGGFGAATSGDTSEFSANVQVTTSSTNAAPVNLLNNAAIPATPATLTTAEDTDLVFSAATSRLLGVSDPDAAETDILRVELRPANGRIRFNTNATDPNTPGATDSDLRGITFLSGSTSTSVVKLFSGTRAALNAALRNVTFQPVANFNGSARLRITTNDLGNSGTGGAMQDQDTLTITVTAVNDAPTARNDTFSTGAGTTSLLPVLQNDSVLPDNNETLSITGVSAATGPGTPATTTTTVTTSNGGTATISGNPGSQISYTAPATVPSGGVDSFSYTLSDNNGGTATATVTVNITGSGAAQPAAGATVTRSGFSNGSTDTRFRQVVTVQNPTSTDIPGPVYLVLDGLSSNATLVNKSGDTINPTVGSPYIRVNDTGLAAGTSATVVLEFENSNDGFITYNTRVLAGPGSP